MISITNWNWSFELWQMILSHIVVCTCFYTAWLDEDSKWNDCFSCCLDICVPCMQSYEAMAKCAFSPSLLYGCSAMNIKENPWHVNNINSIGEIRKDTSKSRESTRIKLFAQMLSHNERFSFAMPSKPTLFLSLLETWCH